MIGDPADRIRRAARAVGEALGAPAHRYLDIVAVVLYADASVNDLEEWGFITHAEAKRAAAEGAEFIREKLSSLRAEPAARDQQAA